MLVAWEVEGVVGSEGPVDELIESFRGDPEVVAVAAFGAEPFMGRPGPPIKGPGIGGAGLGVEHRGLVRAVEQSMPVAHHEQDPASLVVIVGEVADVSGPPRSAALPVVFPTDPTPHRHPLPPFEQLPRCDRGVTGSTGRSPDAQVPVVPG